MLVITLAGNAQQSDFWLTAKYQNQSGFGSIIQIDEDGNQIRRSQLDSLLGAYTVGGFNYTIARYNNKIYGIKGGGGENGFGFIYEYDEDENSVTYLHSFDFGWFNSEAPLMVSDSGVMYAVIGDLLWSYDIVNDVYKELYQFVDSTGRLPKSAPILTSDNKLYGTTWLGGKYFNGVLYCYDLVQKSYRVLLHFKSDTTGANPEFSPMQASNGKIYGVVRSSQMFPPGIVYEYDPNLDSITYVGQYNASNGYNPVGQFLELADGKLYGATQYGSNTIPGSVYSFNPSTKHFVPLEQIKYPKDFYAINSLEQGDSDNLYGYIYRQGPDAVTGMYRYSLSLDTIEFLKEFNGPFISRPQGSPLYDSIRRAIYGYGQHLSHGGALYKFDVDQLSYEILYAFYTTYIGRKHESGLVRHPNGKLYGQCSKGGYNGLGIIYSFNPERNLYLQEFNFDGHKGGIPGQHLTVGLDQLLYGVAYEGGGNGRGVMFSFNPQNNNYAVKCNFHSISAWNPIHSPIEVEQGFFLGATYGGGSQDSGVLYSYDLSADTLIALHSLDARPDQALFKAANGLVYGATLGNSTNTGQIFSYDYSKDEFMALYAFVDSQANHPCGQFVEGDSGKLYGVAQYGGDNSQGSLYEYNYVNNTIKVLHHFSSQTGNDPSYVVIGANNKLYGNTKLGGANDLGVFFEFDLSSETYSVLTHFDSTNGGNSYGKPLENIICLPSSSDMSVASCDAITSPSSKYTYNVSGTYKDTILNSTGCDSVITIVFDRTRLDLDVTKAEERLESNDTAASYQWLRCDSSFMQVAGATTKVFNATRNGSYAVSLELNGCGDTSACFAVTELSVNDVLFSSFTIHPNPTNEVLHLEGENIDQMVKSGNLRITIVDVFGRKVLDKFAESQSLDVSSLSNGMYFLRLSSKANNASTTIRIIKE